MRLGTMLVRDGRLSNAQVEAAVAQQARTGGRLGTVLFEMGLIDADALTVYLGLELGIPIATKAALDRAKRAAVRLLTPELAERFGCVPLVVQDRQLIAAMRDPHDLLALDELGTHTGARVIPRVAPEVRLHYYVERYYGVPRPARFRAMGDRVIETRRAAADSLEPPAPPLPGLPPQVSRVAQPPTPAPMLRPVTEEDADELAMELEADEEETAAPTPVAPVVSAPVATPAAQVAAVATPPRPPMPSGAIGSQLAAPPAAHAAAPVKPLEIDEAVARMADAGSRAEIADALLGFARSLFDVCALLVVRDDLAFGWKGFGPDLDDERIEVLLLPLEAQSIFRIAVEQNDLFAGPAPPTALHGHLFKVLRTAPPQQAVVAQVSIRDRVVNLLYGHRDHDRVLADADLDALRLVSRSAAGAYARLIAVHKKGG